LQLAVGDGVKHPAQRGVGVVHLADVVDAHIPLVTPALEGVGKTARRVVALQHQHFLAGLGHEGRGGQAAEARADDDGVVAGIDRAGKVFLADDHGSFLVGPASSDTVEYSSMVNIVVHH
jgi:hypothetical protein